MRWPETVDLAAHSLGVSVIEQYKEVPIMSAVFWPSCLPCSVLVVPDCPVPPSLPERARTGKGQASSRHWPSCAGWDRGGGRSDESDRDHIRARENACIDLLDWLHLARHCLEPQGSSKLFVSDATVASPSAETRRPSAWARQEPAGQCVASPSA